MIGRYIISIILDVSIMYLFAYSTGKKIKVGKNRSLYDVFFNECIIDNSSLYTKISNLIIIGICFGLLVVIEKYLGMLIGKIL